MTNRSKWLSVAVSLSVIFSMMLVSLASAAGLRHGATKHNATSSKAKSAAAAKAKCATRTKAHGLIKYSDWQFPDTLNGYQSTLAVTSETLQGTQEGLWRYDNHAKLVPLMVTKIPTFKNGLIKDGGKTIIIKIKHGLRWSNGQEITSKDMKFGWQVDNDKVTGPACSGSCDIISRFDTPDKYTAIWHLKSVYAPAIPNAAADIWPTKWPGGWNGSAHDAAVKLEDPAFNFEGPQFPTNGAYQVVSFNKDDRIVLHPMKYYNTMNCGASAANMIFAFYSSKPTMIAAAANKETDVTQDYTVFDIPELAKHTDSYNLHQDPGFIIEHLELNHDATFQGKPNPLANTNVRLALALALDKVGMVQSALSVSKKTAQGVAASTFLVITKTLTQPFADKKLIGQWDPIAKKYVVPGSGQAVADAKKLLAKTPYSGGFPLDFQTTTGNPVRAAQAQVIQNNWKRLGVDVTINFTPASKLFADWDHGGTIDHGDFQIAMFAYLGSPDPDGFKFNMQSKYIDRKAAVKASINANDSGIADPVIDTAYNKAAHTFDLKLRAKYYAQIQVAINQKAHWIPLYFRPTIVTDSGRVANFSNNPTQTGPEWNMYNWKVKVR